MPTITLVGIIVLIVLVIAGLAALGLYLAGFRVTDLKVKLGLAEATMKREPGVQAGEPASTAPVQGIEQLQEATGPASLIADSPQQAGTAGVKQQQSATGGGRIEGSGQTAEAPANQQQRAGNGGVIKNSGQQVE